MEILRLGAGWRRGGLEALAGLLLALPLAAQPQAGATKTGINRNFLPPPQALERQEQHNHFFLSPEPGQAGHILDLQTNAYALAERPEGLTYEVYSAIGYGLATSMMMIGPRVDAEGHRRVVIIDTLEDFGSGQEVAGDYLELYNGRFGTDLDKLPLDAILYTHNHIDHTGGVLGYLSMADKPACAAQNPNVRGLGGDYRARRSCVEVICQEKVVDAVVNTATVSGEAIQARSFYMYGLWLPNELSPDPDPLPRGRAVTNGIGPYLSRGVAGFRLPSRTFAEEMWLTAAGIQMRLLYVPSETNDELAVFVPDALNGAQPAAGQAAAGLLFSAEVIQGPAFPNLYSLRGTQFRSPATWYRSVDKLRQLDSWCMVPSHGPPVCQRDNIQRLLTNFRDAVQYTNDQTVRLMKLGYTADELVLEVKVPEAILDDLARVVPWPNAPDTHDSDGRVHPEDYLLPFYGSVPQAVRAIYAGYLGWFDGDPVNLSPTPPRQAAVKLMRLIGSGQELLPAAREALEAGELQWAAELATVAIRANPDDREARRIKGEAFLGLAERALNPNWSDWYFTSANELFAEPGSCFRPFSQVGLISPVTQAAVPLENLVESLSLSVDGPKAAAAGVESTLGLWIGPTRQDFGSVGYTVELRHGIAQIDPFDGGLTELEAQADVALTLSQDTLDELLIARALGDRDKLEELLQSGALRLLTGSREELLDFLSYFTLKLPDCQAPITVPRR